MFTGNSRCCCFLFFWKGRIRVYLGFGPLEGEGGEGMRSCFAVSLSYPILFLSSGFGHFGV